MAEPTTTPPAAAAAPADARPPAIVVRQYDKIMALRKQLVREGVVTKAATAVEVIEALRRAIPADLFGVGPITPSHAAKPQTPQ